MADLQSQNLTNQIKKIKQNLQAGLPFKYTYQQLQVEQLKCAAYLEDMSNNNNYTHFAEVASIQQKYRLMKQAVKKAKTQNLSQKQLNNLIKKIMIQDVEVLPKDINNLQEQHLDIKSSDVYVPQSSRTIDAFFKKKQTELEKKQKSFKRILNSQVFNVGNQTTSNKSVSKNSRFSKSNIKRDEEKSTRLKNIIEEHKKAISNLQNKIKQDEQLNQFQKNLLRQQKNRYIKKMQQLEQQIEQLYRDNYRLKQLQKTSKVQDSFNASSFKEKDSLANAYEPYVIKTRVNDLNKIELKNQLKQEAKLKQKEIQKQKFPYYEPEPDYLGDKLQKEKVFTAKQFFNKKHPNYGLYDEKFLNKKNQSSNMILKDLLGDSFQHGKPPISKGSPSNNFSIGSIGNGNHFDTFQLAQTLPYINDSILGQSRNIINMTKEVSTRNKVAFFKNSLVLIRNQEIEIAFKRSDLNQTIDRIRLIFYINNKTNRARKINITYEYQREYFNIKVQEKIKQVAPRSQGREAITIDLISRIDLNGVSDVHFYVDQIIYDLWLPINFIRFKHADNYRMSADTMQMTVLPDRQFSSCSEIEKIAPIMFGGQDSSEVWAYLYGQSKFGNYPIKLTWRERDLILETSQKWLDFIGFVFHFFK